MKTTELTTSQFCDFLEASEILIAHDTPGSMARLNVVSHPVHGDCLLFQISDKGILIEPSAPGESVHDHARAVAAMSFR